MSEQHQKETQRQCHNCGTPLSAEDVYCPNCGQEYKEKLLSLWEILSKAFTDVFNLDARLWVTFTKLWIPGYLAQAYVRGQRKRYVNPFRFFFLTSLLLIAVAAIDTNLTDQRDSQNNRTLRKNQISRAIQQEMDSLYQSTRLEYNAPASLETIDSLQVRMDKLLQGENTRITTNVGPFFRVDHRSYWDSTKIILVEDTLWIDNSDFVLLDSDSLTTKYVPDGDLFECFIFKQGHKSVLYGNNLAQFAFKQGFITFFVLVPLLALWFKLLYIRRKRYYIEHLLLCLNVHTFAFVLMILSELTDRMAPRWVVGFTLFGLLAYLYAAMIKFYGQGYVKTLVKLLLTLPIYLICLVIGIIATVAFSFLFF